MNDIDHGYAVHGHVLEVLQDINGMGTAFAFSLARDYTHPEPRCRDPLAIATELIEHSLPGAMIVSLNVTSALEGHVVVEYPRGIRAMILAMVDKGGCL